MPRLAAPLRFAVPAIVLAALLSAHAPAAAAADAVPVKKWTASVCQAFGRWEERLMTLAAHDAPADPAAARVATVKFLRGAVRATDKLATTLHKAGAPDVKGGPAIAAAFARSLKALRADFARAKKAAARLATEDPGAFATASEALASDLEVSAVTFSTALAKTADRHGSRALDRAFARAKGCRAIT